MSRVLVVDDDLGTLETCGAVLRCAGLAVETAASGRCALDVLRQVRCDLLLTDLRMPDMSGLQLLANLRQSEFTVPALVMTGYPTIESSDEATRLGVVGYLVKPVFDDVLVCAVRRGLGEQASTAPDRIIGDGDATSSGSDREVEAGVGVIKTGEPPRIPDGLAQWATAMSRAIHARGDVKTTAEWAALLCIAPATLRGWCRVAHLGVKESLDLARVLRAVSYGRRLGSVVGRFLNVQDHHTLERLLAAAGIGGSPEVPTVEDVLTRQTLVRDPVAVNTLRDLIVKPGGTPESS